jgi:hypothetical protein
MVSYLCLTDNTSAMGEGCTDRTRAELGDTEMGGGDWVASPVCLPRPRSRGSAIASSKGELQADSLFLGREGVECGIRSGHVEATMTIVIAITHVVAGSF